MMFEKSDDTLRVQLNLCKNLKSKGGVGGAGSPPMMCEKSDDSNRGAIESLQKI